MGLFYLGTRSVNQNVGYEVMTDHTGNNYELGWAWGPSPYTEVYKNNFYAIADGQWHCWSTAFDGTDFYHYQDGVLVAQYTASSMNITNKVIYIGSRIDDRRYWRGALSRVAIHNYAFTATDAAHYMSVTQ